MDKIAIFKMMLEKDKENYEAWFLLAEEYRQRDSLADALFAYAKALEKNDPKMREMVIRGLRALTEGGNKQETAEGQADVHGLEPEQAVSLEDITQGSCEDIEAVILPSAEMQLSREDEGLNKDKEESKKAKIRVLEGGKKHNVVSIGDYLPERVTFADVGGLHELKKTIEMKIIKPFQSPGLFSKFQKKSGGGILLYGPPGCGKTFIAQAMAGEVGANFFPVHISEILNPYFGVSEKNLHHIFETARASRPAVLFFDEIDTLGYSRLKSGSDLMRSLVDTLLTEMQSINMNTDKLLVIGATNMPWDVDPALKRPGRFDKMIFVPPPDKEARKRIFQLKLGKRPVAGLVDLEVLAEKTVHYSGADIENIVELAAERVIDSIMETGVERGITMADLLEVIAETKPSTLEWISIVKNYVKYANQSGLYNEVADYIRKYL